MMQKMSAEFTLLMCQYAAVQLVFKKKKKDDIALQECLHNIDVSFFDTGTWHIQLFLNFDPILLWSLPYVPQNICSRQVCTLNTFSLLLCGKNH